MIENGEGGIRHIFHNIGPNVDEDVQMIPRAPPGIYLIPIILDEISSE